SGHWLPQDRRRSGIELAERGAGAAREHQDVVRDRHRGRGGRGDGAVEVADDDVDAVDLHQLLRGLDTGLRVTLTVLRIRELDGNTGEVERLQSRRGLIHGKARGFVPALPAGCGIAG